MTRDEFFRKFGLFAGLPDAVAKMRELILALAVRGQLSQPALDDDLVDDFVAELAAAESRPRPTALNSVVLAFEIPSHWRWVRFGDITNFRIGRTPPRGDAQYWWPGSHPWASIGDLQHYATLLETKEKVSDRAACEIFKGQLASAGSILMSFKLTIGKVARAGMSCFHNEAIISFRPPDGLDQYLFRFMPVFAALQTTNSAVKGATLNSVLLRSLPVGLPPLAEQKRIVAKVDELMALCDQLEAQQKERETLHVTLARASLSRFAAVPTPSNLTPLFYSSYTIPSSELRKAILTLAVQGKLVPQDFSDEPVSTVLRRFAQRPATSLQAVSEPVDGAFEVPPGWAWVRLADLVASMSNGIYKPAKFFNDTGTACVRMFNIQDGRLALTKLKRLDLTASEIDQYRLEAGDLLLNRVNSRELVGKCAVVEECEEPLVFEAMNIRIRLLERVNLPRYVNLVFRTERVRRLFQERSKQAIGQASINQPQVACLTIPLPPLAEQRRIVAKVDQLMVLVDELETRVADSQGAAAKLLEAIVGELTA